jgi:cyclic beta-1,2-glucan synthetase
MYRAGLESMLGLRRRGDTFSIDPCIPSSWPEYEIAWRVGGTQYLISVSNPERQCRGVLKASLDEAEIDAAAIPLVDDGRTHQVRIVLGRTPSRNAAAGGSPRRS